MLHALHWNKEIALWKDTLLTVAPALTQESGGIQRRALIAALLVGGSAAWWKLLDSKPSPLRLPVHTVHTLTAGV